MNPELIIDVAKECQLCKFHPLNQTSKSLEVQKPDTQQLKAEILRYANEGIELCFDAGCDERIATRFEKIIAKLSAV